MSAEARTHAAGGHSHAAGANETRVKWAMVIIGSFMIVEVAGGVISGSLALLADAVHMITDFVALFLAWLGFRLARRPADWNRTYGYDRFQVLVAFTNGIVLFLVAGWIAYEAYHRLESPVPVLGGVMTIIAVTGLIVNILAFYVLMGADRENLNIRGASLHVLGDLLGSLAALTAGIVIMVTAWTPIDPILSVFVALIILKSAYGIVRESAHILLEGTPRGVDPREISLKLTEQIDGVESVHHVHAWSITQERPMATLNVSVAKGADTAAIVRRVKAAMANQFGIAHTTVEIDSGSNSPEQIAEDAASGGSA